MSDSQARFSSDLNRRSVIGLSIAFVLAMLLTWIGPCDKFGFPTGPLAHLAWFFSAGVVFVSCGLPWSLRRSLVGAIAAILFPGIFMAAGWLSKIAWFTFASQ